MREFKKIISDIRNKRPLIYNITNHVVTNVSANALLAIGASPIMSFSKYEAHDLVKISSALVLNMGTPTTEVLDAMLVAGKYANEYKVPVIFDPVGLGASAYRKEVANKILSEIKIDIIKGNSSEIANLSGSSIQMKGVDSDFQVQNIVGIVKQLAKKFNCTVCSTGEVDIISDAYKTYTCRNGHILLTKITGSGCILGSITGACAACCSDYAISALCACVIMGICAEQATEKTTLLGSFQTELFDQLSSFNEASFKNARYEIL